MKRVSWWRRFIRALGKRPLVFRGVFYVFSDVPVRKQTLQMAVERLKNIYAAAYIDFEFEWRFPRIATPSAAILKSWAQEEGLPSIFLVRYAGEEFLEHDGFVVFTNLTRLPLKIGRLFGLPYAPAWDVGNVMNPYVPGYRLTWMQKVKVRMYPLLEEAKKR